MPAPFTRADITPTIPQPKVPRSKGWNPADTRKPAVAVRDPNGVMARFQAQKEERARVLAQLEAEAEQARRDHFQETGHLMPEPEPEIPEPARKRGGFYRKPVPADLWVAKVDGSLEIQTLGSTGEAHDLGKELSSHRDVRFCRVISETGRGKLYQGAGWARVCAPWEAKPVNIKPEEFREFTAPERRQVAGWEIPVYIKPGAIIKDMAQKNPSWQTCKDSKKGQTFSRMQRSQGLGR